MIPYQLKIQGVRDYSTRSIHFGDADEHILITGPNGVGKSTLTFCLGAVLYSSKVEVEGLRSTNLKPEHPWNAKITLVFLNEGPTKVDGPKFIAFQLTVHQPVKNGPLQREYEVLGGLSEDELTVQASYTSGGAAGRTLGAYREDLQIRYKIDPDLYYLIWYQQEVNQFASMYPEERFRKFSDMFHISDTQKEWEASLAQIKEVQVEIEYLKAIQKGAELSVNAAKTDLNRYLDNKKRIQTSGIKYFTLLHQIINKYKSIIEKTGQLRSSHQVEKEKQLLEQQKTKNEIQKFNVEKAEIEIALQQEQHMLVEIDKALQDKRRQDQQKQEQQKKLQQLLESTTEKAKMLRNDTPTTQRLLNEMIQKNEQLSKEEITLSKQSVNLREQERLTSMEVSRLKTALTNLKEELASAERHIAMFNSSAFINDKIQIIEHQNAQDFEQIQFMKKEEERLQQFTEQLKLKKVISKRQQQGLADLKRNHIEAYTLRELIELIPSAPLHLEKQIEAIKYTIFYVGNHYKPINDLYYVSLNQLVPTQSISKIPELGLQIRNDLSEQMCNYANKALWWIKQFFVSSPKIKQSILYDERGVRGAQEVAQYILSDAAIEKLLEEYETQLNDVRKKLQQLQEQYKNNQKQQNELYGYLRTIQQAESILLKQSELALIDQELNSAEKLLSDIYDAETDLENKISKLRTELSDVKYNLDFYESQWKIIEDLGEFAEQQLQLQKVEDERKTIQLAIRVHSSDLETKELKVAELNRKLSGITEMNQIALSKLKVIEREITGLDLSIRKADEKLEADEAMKFSYETDLAELENILPDEAQQIDERLIVDESITRLINESEQAKATLNTARMEKVNENAQLNYEQLKADYDTKNADLAEAEQLLESNSTRANELEDRLETTINMYLTKINALFQKYMDLFQFEGQIEKERIEEKSGRIKFQLFIKARKIGHQGALEDVSVKARSGKVGKGVSGGEESLSSLLFALALLQNLSISPGYIVLDEFDSALDDERKNKVFNLYAEELERKLIIVSPKGHDETYYNCFSRVFIIEHDASVPKSTIRGIKNRM